MLSEGWLTVQLDCCYKFRMNIKVTSISRYAASNDGKGLEQFKTINKIEKLYFLTINTSFFYKDIICITKQNINEIKFLHNTRISYKA